MNDAQALMTYVECLARHVELADELSRHSFELLQKVQNEGTCDSRPDPAHWTECKRIIEACGIAVRLCKQRSEELRRWAPATTSRV